MQNLYLRRQQYFLFPMGRIFASFYGLSFGLSADFASAARSAYRLQMFWNFSQNLCLNWKILSHYFYATKDQMTLTLLMSQDFELVVKFWRAHVTKADVKQKKRFICGCTFLLSSSCPRCNCKSHRRMSQRWAFQKYNIQSNKVLERCLGEPPWLPCPQCR